MYLSKKTYVKNWDHAEEDAKVHIQISGNKDKIKNINLNKVKYIEEEAIYWRKANAIHKFFIDNCGNGEDDCSKNYYVSMDQLKELYNICKQIVEKCKFIVGDGDITNKNLAEELLPTQSGFFFGNTDYNEYYLEDMKYTMDQLKPIIEVEDDHGEYYYSASW